jgi:hypothetical protein
VTGRARIALRLFVLAACTVLWLAVLMGGTG